MLHTIVDQELRAALEKGCRDLDLNCIGALDPLISALARYLGASLSTRVGAQHALDADYFERMDALNFAMTHDDGLSHAHRVDSYVTMHRWPWPSPGFRALPLLPNPRF